MRHICSRCRLTSVDGNLWCQEVDCPAGSLPSLFKYGDYLGNLKILELMRVLRTATIYKAERGVDKERETLMLKVSNPGEENINYLKKEAEALHKIAASDRYRHAALPVWKPHGAVNRDESFGIAQFRDQLRYYFVTDFVDGEFLSDALLDNPQPWHEHAGWLMLSLSEALFYVQKVTQALHLNLNPDVIMIHYNNLRVPQPLLVDMGMQVKIDQQIPPSEAPAYQRALLPAYTPRELIEGGVITQSTDVYLLGLILYELLAAHPAHPYTLRRTEDIFADIEQQSRIPLTRKDLPAQPRAARSREADMLGMLEIVRRAINYEHPKRFKDVTEFRTALLSIYGGVPDKFRFSFGWLFKGVRNAVVAGVLGLTVMFIVIVLLSALFNQ